MTRTRVALASVALALVALAPSASEPPAPLSSLPSYMRVLVDWGVRPEWSRDGRYAAVHGARPRRRLRRGRRRRARSEPLTAHFYNPGFDRVLALANGDYLLTGPREVGPEGPVEAAGTRASRCSCSTAA